MSHMLVVEISDDVYAAIERQAVATQVSPAHIAATSLEQHFRAEHSALRNVLARTGLTAAHPAPLTHAQPLTHKQRKELAEQVAHGRPLSEYIHNERRER